MWLTTWTRFDRPQYAVHPTEQAAEAHATELVRSGATTHATAYEMGES
jgi:hypothetical protein